MDISLALKKLRRGENIILPTDTLYGVAGLAYDYESVKGVFDIKKRPYDKQLPVHYSSINFIDRDCFLDDKVKFIMNKFWPGPLSIVLKKKKTSELKFVSDTVAVRVPDNKVTLDIISQLGEPIVMPSANISNEKPELTFEKVQSALNLDGVEDDSNISSVASTIVSYENNTFKLIRQGVIKFEDIVSL